MWVDQSRYRVLAAGRRFGKTTLAVHELLQNALLYDSSLNWYLSPTYKQSKMIAWKMLCDIVPDSMIVKKYEVELRIILNDRSEICLKGADNEDSLRGVGVSFIVMDEFGFMKSNVWPEIIRPMLTDTQGRALFIGTPKGKNAFFEIFLKGEKAEDEFKSWRFKTVDNASIDLREEVEKAKKELPERVFRQEYEASFEDYTGLIWPEFCNKHILFPRSIPIEWEHVGVIDPATTGTTAALFAAIDTEGEIYVYDEYYEANKRVSEVARVIRSESKRWIIDPAAKVKEVMKEGKLYSFLDEYRENGIYANLGENDVDAGINRVGEYFKTNKIHIFKTCKNLIYELERYHWTEDKETGLGIVKPKPYKKDDHLCDCLRYLVMSRPAPGHEATPELKKGSVAYEEMLIAKENKNWKSKWS